jgi:hypothetical protein
VGHQALQAAGARRVACEWMKIDELSEQPSQRSRMARPPGINPPAIERRPNLVQQVQLCQVVNEFTVRSAPPQP